MLKVIMVQSANGARAFIGPFQTADEAHAYANEKYGTDSNPWWIVDINPPGSQYVAYVQYTN